MKCLFACVNVVSIMLLSISLTMCFIKMQHVFRTTIPKQNFKTIYEYVPVLTTLKYSSQFTCLNVTMFFGNKCHYVCEDTLLLQDFMLLPQCIWALHSSGMLCSKHWKSKMTCTTWPLMNGPIWCPKMLLTSCQSTPHNNPEKQRLHIAHI